MIWSLDFRDGHEADRMKAIGRLAKRMKRDAVITEAEYRQLQGMARDHRFTPLEVWHRVAQMNADHGEWAVAA
jgi:hypothetical protein